MVLVTQVLQLVNYFVIGLSLFISVAQAECLVKKDETSWVELTGSELQRHLAETPGHLGVYTGTFDPPHYGHLETVKSFVRKHSIRILYIVTNASTPKKPDASSFEIRIGLARTLYSTMVIDPKGPDVLCFYDGTVGTSEREEGTQGIIKKIQLHHPDRILIRLTGDDHLSDVIRTFESREINYTLVVSRRSGGESSVLIDGERGRVLLEDLGEPYGLSSTKIRTMIASGRAEEARELLPVVIFELIQKLGLYSK